MSAPPTEVIVYGSIFTGFAGLDLGLDRAGWRCVFQVEIEEYARAILRRHWPDVPKFSDVRTVTADQLARIDALAGGFPCQDVSNAGTRLGLDGARSGLWREFDRLIGEIKPPPRIIVIENVAALRSRGLEVVLRDLAARGYDGEWDCLPAAAFGAPHLRDRLFLVAWHRTAPLPFSDTDCECVRFIGKRGRKQRGERWTFEPGDDGQARLVAYPLGEGRAFRPADGTQRARISAALSGGENVAHAEIERRGPRRDGVASSAGIEPIQLGRRGEALADANSWGQQIVGAAHNSNGQQSQRDDAHRCRSRIFCRRELERFRSTIDHWRIEPDVGRVAHGVPDRVERLAGLGNAVVPFLGQFIGLRVLDILGIER